MTAMRRGINPCTICGELTSGSRGVCCSQCRRKVADYDRLVVEREQSSQVVVLPSGWVSLSSWTDDSRKLEKHLVAYFDSLPLSTNQHEFGCDEDHADVKRKVKMGRGSTQPCQGHKLRVVPPGAGRFLADLYAMTDNALDAAYEKGKADGSDLRASLNRGELTTTDFERRSGIVRRRDSDDSEE